MKAFISAFWLFSLCAVSYADFTVYEDFESYDLGTIDQQGITSDYGYDIAMWCAQDNTSVRADSGSSNVVSDFRSKYLELVNRDSGGNIDTVYTTLYLGSDNIIDDMGTVCIFFKSTSANDCILATNSLFPGYATNAYGAAISDTDGYQGTANYGSQAQLVRLGGGDQAFRAYDEDGYSEVSDFTLKSDTWHELYIQFDCVNQRSRYYICEADMPPMPGAWNSNRSVVVPNPDGGEWWGWRNKDCHTVENLKFFMGMDDQASEDTVSIGYIAVDPHQWSSNIWPPYPPFPCPDPSGNGVIDLDDFIILKQNYGASPADWTMGDFNGDNVVNLDDFIILKRCYGMTY